MVQPVLGSPPHCENKQEFKFAIQTSQVSCSPTSAVNLLKFYDVQATESEMARLCLTRESRSWLGFRLAEGGTSWLGLYRGLKLKLQDTDFEPIFFSMSFERFLEESGRGRLITALKLRSSLEQENPEQFQYLREGGWQPEVEHNVVFLGIEKDVVSLIDPKVGYEEMDLKDFRELWVGRGIFLEKK